MFSIIQKLVGIDFIYVIIYSFIYTIPKLDLVSKTII